MAQRGTPRRALAVVMSSARRPVQMVSGISRRQPPLESLVPGTARFCCSLLDGDPRLKHFHKKCVMYEPAGAGCASAARTLDDFYRF